MRDNEFEDALQTVILAGLAHDGLHKCPACRCMAGPEGWHRHCEGECNPTAFGLAGPRETAPRSKAAQ